jgi:hypothetical protein
VSSRRRLSPAFGGAGARWAQVLLFVLHLALLISLVYLIVTYRSLRSRLPIARWQEILLLIGVALSLVVYTRRAWRIGSDLWRALRGEIPPEEENEFEDDDPPGS